ncbi:hypothetical protein LDENG_00275370 [Lucifuga dentata]|nr:hypothetical protein LDENG_00275370 [Lucifuga dentata]
MDCFAIAVLVITLLGFINLSRANKDTCDLYATVGQNVTLPLANKALDNTDMLRWTHNNTIIFYRQQRRVSVGKPEDISVTGSLLLRNLKFSNAGIYKALVLNKNDTLVKQQTSQLCMMAKVWRSHGLWMKRH